MKHQRGQARNCLYRNAGTDQLPAGTNLEQQNLGGGFGQSRQTQAHHNLT